MFLLLKKAKQKKIFVLKKGKYLIVIQIFEILHLSKKKFITDGSVNTLIELFKRNHSLRELWTQNCALSGNGKQKLKQMIRSKTNFRLEF